MTKEEYDRLGHITETGIAASAEKNTQTMVIQPGASGQLKRKK